MKKHNFSVIFVGLLIAVTILVLVLVMCYSSKNQIGIDINLLFIITMLVIVLINYFTGIGKSEKVIKDFERFHHFLDRHTDNAITLKDFKFETDELQNAYHEYLIEVERIDGYGENINVDISDYINYSLIDSIIKKDYSEQIPNAMTGLGILGTFIGLTLGLNNFNLDTDNTDKMLTSVSSLMDGITTAFLTSIFGVIYSLVVNQLYKHFYCAVCDKLNEFYAEYAKVVPSPQSSFIKNVVSNQEHQTQLLANFSDNFSDTLANKLNEIFKPTLDYFNESIEHFIEKSVVSHNESLDLIVKSFVDNMNVSLGNQFEQLGETLSQLNTSQIDNANRLQAVVDNVCSTASRIEIINTSLDNSILKLNDYIDKIDTLQGNVNAANEKLTQDLSELSRFQTENINIISQFNEYQKNTAAAVTELKNSINSFQSQTETMYKKQIESIQRIVEESDMTILEYAESSESIVREIHENTNNAIEKINSAAGAQYNDLAKSTAEIIDYSQNQIKEQAERSKEVLNEVINSTQSAINEIKELISESSNILKTQLSMADNISEHIDSNMKSISNSINQQFGRIENDISKVLEKTFTDFDIELAKIATRFASAIGDNSRTIDKMDNYINDVPKKLYAVIEELMDAIRTTVVELKRNETALLQANNSADDITSSEEITYENV